MDGVQDVNSWCPVYNERALGGGKHSHPTPVQGMKTLSRSGRRPLAEAGCVWGSQPCRILWGAGGREARRDEDPEIPMLGAWEAEAGEFKASLDGVGV